MKTNRELMATEAKRIPLAIRAIVSVKFKRMSTSQILAQLPSLSAAERAQVQAKLDELAGDEWQDQGELSDADKTALDAELADYARSPDEGSSWEEVKARIQAKLRS